jgi:hypothetical protein
MEAKTRGKDPQLTIEERRIRLDEQRLNLESSFARKWLPALVTLMAGLIAAMIGIFQQRIAADASERASAQLKEKNEHDWGVKVIEMYLNKRELFDLTKNADQAGTNLSVLAAVAPKAVQDVFEAEKTRIPRPTGSNEQERLRSLAAVAGVQKALAKTKPAGETQTPTFKPSDFTIYLQYSDGDRVTAEKTQTFLAKLGYRVPGMEQVAVTKAPSRLQVRYYRPEQLDFAVALVTELGNDLNLPVRPDSAILVDSTKQLPSGILEVWLPPQRR